MKTVVTIGIGGRSFTIDDDAYLRLNDYLNAFRRKTGNDSQTKEVMDEVELRISELFSEGLAASRKEVVDIALVNEVIAKVGMPDGSDPWSFTSEQGFGQSGQSCYGSANGTKAPKRLYRNPDDKKIAGVCSGLAAYFDIDVTILRVIFTVALICGLAGFWVYIIFWIVTPLAMTAAQKCEMRGIPATAENMKKYTATRL